MLINLLALIVKFYEIVDIGLYWLVWCLLCVDNVRQYIVYTEPTSRHDALMITTCSDNDSAEAWPVYAPSAFLAYFSSKVFFYLFPKSFR